MATNWPTSRDTFTNPTSGDTLDSPSHAAQHANINDAVEAMQLYAGLVLVKTQTIGTAVSSVTVTDAFSSTFDNYLVTIDNVDSSANGHVQLQLGSTTTGYSYSLLYTAFTNSAVAIGASSQAIFRYCGAFYTTNTSIVIPINGPYAAQYTIVGPVSYADPGAAGTFTGIQVSTTSFTGFLIQPSGGTLTGGTIRVYGLNKG